MRLNQKGVQKLKYYLNSEKSLDSMEFEISDFCEIDAFINYGISEASVNFILVLGETVGLLHGIGQHEQADRLTNAFVTNK